MMRPPMMMCYGHQMYGNADGTMQQLRNQNQTTIDQINSMTSALRSLQNENKKNETLINELKKQHKEAEHGRDKAKIDLEIAEDKTNDIESMLKQREHYIDKTQQLEKQISEQGGENNRLQQAKEIEELKRVLHEQQMEAIRQKQAMDENKLAAELKSVKDETQILMTKNKTMYDYMSTQEFSNPLDYLPNTYVQKMKEQDKNDLMIKWMNIAKENKAIKEKYDNDYEKYNEQMVEPIKNNISELRKSEMLLDRNVIYQYVKHLFLNKTFVTKTKI